MYFGASFSRYGFDFRPLFIQLFSQTTLKNFQNSLCEANQLFEQLLNSYTFDQYVQLTSLDSSTTLNPFTPPMILVSYTPLAVYCNVLLSAFNDLRLCCPLSTVVIIKQLVTDSLIHIRNLLLNYYNSEKSTLTVIESEHFIGFLRVFIIVFIPYINTCIQALFPDMQLARELGTSVLDVSEKSKLNRLEIDQISEPIKNVINSVVPKNSQSPETVSIEADLMSKKEIERTLASENEKQEKEPKQEQEQEEEQEQEQGRVHEQEQAQEHEKVHDNNNKSYEIE